MNKSTKLYLFECFFSVFMFYDRDRLSMPPTSIFVTLLLYQRREESRGDRIPCFTCSGWLRLGCRLQPG